MRLPPNARRFRGRPPEDDPLLAFRRQQGQGGGAAVAESEPDPLASFRARHADSVKLNTAVPVAAPTPAAPAELPGDRWMGRLAAGYQGLTFGAGDKIIAGIQTALPEALGGQSGFNYKRNLRDTRAVLDQYRENHPVESVATEIVGGLPAMVAAAPLSLTSRVASAGRVARIAALSGEGAVVGGAVGGLDAIRPDATLEDVGKGAGVGAATGAVLTPVLAPALAGVARGVGRAAARFAPEGVADRIATFMGGDAVTPRGKARDAIRGALESGGVDPAAAAKTTGLIEPVNPPAPVPTNTGRRFPVTEQTVTDYMAQKGLPREEAVKRLTEAGYDVPAPVAPVAAKSFEFPERPRAGQQTPHGLDISDKIDNQASIDATFDHENDYERLPGIRQIQLEGPVGPDAFKDATFPKGGFQRIKNLAAEIQNNNRIDPLIWIDDPSGGYLLEGSHRIDALRYLGHDSFPALVVRDLKSAAATAGEETASAAVAPVAGGRQPNADIRRIADEYRYGHAVEGEALPHPGKVDVEKAGVMAHAYEALKNDPNDPEVIAAYRALAEETRAQADALMRAGYKPEFMENDPYHDSAEMMKDLAEKKTIRVFKTNKENPHPLLTDEENNLFRWVHDVFGHAQSGNQFGPLGEERAFRDHASMFSPTARRAMATETRGQNSWVNFGPNKDLPITERPFAEQKAAVMPEELTRDYGNIPRESPTTVMELGSRQVPSLVRAARNVPTSTAGQTTDRFLSERAAGAGKRIERALNEATGHEASDSWMPVEQLIEKRSEEARPLYEEAEKYGPIQNPETVAQIALLRKHPVFARAWARGQAMGELEGNPATRRVVTQEAQAAIPRIAPDAPPPEPPPVPSGKPTSTREAIAAFQDRSAAAASRTEGTSIQQQARAALERRSAESELPDAPRRLVGGTLQEPRAAVPEESMQAPTVQQINRWKKGLDAVINSGYGSDNAVSREEARLFRKKLNDVLARVDEEVPAYKKARQGFAGNSELVEASEAGAEHFKPGTPTGALERQIASFSPGELEAYRANALNKLVEKIRTVATNPDLPEAGRSTNILQRIMGTEDAGQRLGMLFPDEKSFEGFLRQVEDEALYPKTDRFLRGQSSTAAQLAEGGVSIKTWADLAKSPFSNAARFRLAKRVAEGTMANDPLPPKVANEVAEMATTTGYRLRALLQDMASDKAAREEGRRRLLSFSNAALAGGIAPAARRRLPEK